MKKTISFLAFSAAAVMMFGCNKIDTTMNPSASPETVSIASEDKVHILLTKNDKTMWRVYGKGFTQIFTQVQGTAKGVSVGSSDGWEYYVSNPTNFSSGQTWHIGADANYNGHLWRVETRTGTTPGWVTRSIIIGGTTILATDIAAKKDFVNNNDKVMAIGATSTSGSNIYLFNQSARTWSVFGGTATRIAIDDAMNPWCINASGQVYKYEAGSWKRKDEGYTAVDIGCGGPDGGVYVVTNVGSLLRYTGSGWVFLQEFYKLGKRAKRISASYATCIVSTTTGEAYCITPDAFAWAGTVKLTISNVDDVSMYMQPGLGN